MQRVAVCRTYKSKSKNSNIMQSLSKPESIRHGAAKRTADHPIRSRQLLDHGLHHADGDAKFLQRKGDNLNQEHFDSDIASWLSSPVTSLWIQFLRNYQKIDMNTDTNYDYQLALLDLIKGSVINERGIGMEKFLQRLDSEIVFVTYQKRDLEEKKQDQLMQRMAKIVSITMDEESKIDKQRIEMKKEKTRQQNIQIEKLKKEMKMNEIEKDFLEAGNFQGYYFGRSEDESSDSDDEMFDKKKPPAIFKNHFDSTGKKRPNYLLSDTILKKKVIRDFNQMEIDRLLRPEMDELQSKPQQKPEDDFLSDINPIYKHPSSSDARQNRKDEQYLKFKKIQEEFERAEKYRK